MDKPEWDENEVQYENTGLDKRLKRDPYKYMRLQGTEFSFLKLNNVEMYEKDENGEYQLVSFTSDGKGTLVLTSRRLTFSTLSTRGARSTFIPIVGKYNYKFKERDFIRYSIPTFLLTGSFIRGDIEEYWAKSSKWLSYIEPFEWEIKKDNIKFLIYFFGDKKQTDTINHLNNFYFNILTEHLMGYLKFFLKDTDLYPGWDWDRDKDDEPNVKIELGIEERKELFKVLYENYGYHWFIDENESKSKDQIEKILQEKLKSINYELFSRTSSKNKSQRASKKVEKFPNDNKKKYISHTKNITEELEKLGSLKEKGLLTDEEFSAAKAKLLDK